MSHLMGKLFPFKGKRVSRAIPGERSTGDQLAWAHCNHFKGTSDAAFEGLAASIKLGGWATLSIAEIERAPAGFSQGPLL